MTTQIWMKRICVMWMMTETTLGTSGGLLVAERRGPMALMLFLVIAPIVLTFAIFGAIFIMDYRDMKHYEEGLDDVDEES
jgi:hypothetical protein